MLHQQPVYVMCASPCYLDKSNIKAHRRRVYQHVEHHKQGTRAGVQDVSDAGHMLGQASLLTAAGSADQPGLEASQHKLHDISQVVVQGGQSRQLIASVTLTGGCVLHSKVDDSPGQ